MSMNRSRRVAVTGGILVALLIGVPAGTAAGANGANVAKASGALLPNPGFAPNAIDSVNPTIGGEARVHLVVGADGRTLVTLHVKGLPAARSFAAHLHRDPCSTSFGGPHYQSPTGTPAAFATPLNEVWLDFTTNAAGNGRSLAVVPFEVLSGARSVIIHQGDNTPPGGIAGQRLACINVSV